jgi:hypothetical protein
MVGAQWRSTQCRDALRSLGSERDAAFANHVMVPGSTEHESGHEWQAVMAREGARPLFVDGERDGHAPLRADLEPWRPIVRESARRARVR